MHEIPVGLSPEELATQVRKKFHIGDWISVTPDLIAEYPKTSNIQCMIYQMCTNHVVVMTREEVKQSLNFLDILDKKIVTYGGLEYDFNDPLVTFDSICEALAAEM